LDDEVERTWQKWLSETTKTVRIIDLQVWTRNSSNAKQERGTFNFSFYENVFQRTSFRLEAVMVRYV
jgi:hypothetical protein